MSDETEMNSELEAFESGLRKVPAPKTNLDRDQLMYDAGWAAAIASREPVANASIVKSNRSSGSIVISFASGVAVAAAMVILAMPYVNSASTNQRVATADKSTPSADEDMASNQDIAVPTIEVAQNDDRDLLKWLEELPNDGTITASFSRQSVANKPQITQSDISALDSQPSQPATSATLLRELLPGNARRPVTPAWSTFSLPTFN